jgi:hypothetical protein
MTQDRAGKLGEEALDEVEPGAVLGRPYMEVVTRAFPSGAFVRSSDTRLGCSPSRTALSILQWFNYTGRPVEIMCLLHA